MKEQVNAVVLARTLSNRGFNVKIQYTVDADNGESDPEIVLSVTVSYGGLEVETVLTNVFLRNNGVSPHALADYIGNQWKDESSRIAKLGPRC